MKRFLWECLSPVFVLSEKESETDSPIFTWFPATNCHFIKLSVYDICVKYLNDIAVHELVRSNHIYNIDAPQCFQ